MPNGMQRIVRITSALGSEGVRRPAEEPDRLPQEVEKRLARRDTELFCPAHKEQRRASATNTRGRDFASARRSHEHVHRAAPPQWLPDARRMPRRFSQHHRGNSGDVELLGKLFIVEDFFAVTAVLQNAAEFVSTEPDLLSIFHDYLYLSDIFAMLKKSTEKRFCSARQLCRGCGQKRRLRGPGDCAVAPAGRCSVMPRSRAIG